MIRWPPFGQPAGTAWENGNPATGKRGSILDARAVDHSQAEITNAITRFGLTPDANNLEQLGLAIQNYVSSLTGEGGDDTFLTVPSARATLPIYPEVLTADGRLAISSPSSGTLFVAASGAIRHRGVADVLMSDIAEVDRTFAMLPSKVAHLRWSPTGGLQRFYLDDAGYNPLGLPETDVAFDASYDSAMLALATTDASANVTIRRLRNLDRGQMLFERTVPLSFGAAVTLHADAYVCDFARRPMIMLRGFNENASASNLDGGETAIYAENVSRYGFTVRSFTLNSSTFHYWAPLHSAIAALGGPWL